ncbi:hypothetical protein TUM4261_02660 [Shewanella sp. c952]|uniref:hypothetical protein n=1 Tax=Shewanella sp. c952 TaxID=2815913 RepID=UPI001BC46921|nr:hypothetical protein [Shewanella sp. c952]GIU03907.1 hypothetical protein TUM4261_02660 [Shewanella sp. c952]
MIHKLFGPAAQLAVGLLAFIGVILIQIFLHRRAKTEMRARFEQLDMQHQHERRVSARKEKLSNLEPMFNLLFELRQFHSELYKTEIEPNQRKGLSEAEIIEQIESIKKSLSDQSENQMRLNMLIHVYTPELKDQLFEYEEASSNISITCWSYISSSNSNLNNAFFELESRITELMKTINKLQSSLVKSSQNSES